MPTAPARRGRRCSRTTSRLAEANEPIWPGCVSASDDAWKSWLASREVVNFAWSSQGRGFFTAAAGRDKRDNAELVRVWYSEQNFARRDRAIELANELGKSPIQVALAYCLNQPFPLVPLIGPRRLLELDDSLAALDIALTPAAGPLAGVPERPTSHTPTRRSQRAGRRSSRSVRGPDAEAAEGEGEHRLDRGLDVLAAAQAVLDDHRVAERDRRRLEAVRRQVDVGDVELARRHAVGDDARRSSGAASPCAPGSRPSSGRSPTCTIACIAVVGEAALA